MSDRPLSRRVVPELGPPGAVQIDSVGGDVAGTRIGDVYELARRIHSYRDGTSSNRFSANLELRRALADADPRDVRARADALRISESGGNSRENG